MKPNKVAAEAQTALGFVDDEYVAALLGINLSTLGQRRSKGTAPPSHKVGSKHLTDVKALTRWIKQHGSRRQRAPAEASAA